MTLDFDLEQAKAHARSHPVSSKLVPCVNDPILSVRVDDHHLGEVIYSGPQINPNRNTLLPEPTYDDIKLFLLPPFSPADCYQSLSVHIPAQLIPERNNIAVRVGALWGTDIYSDDSDVVAAIIHSGMYDPNEPSEIDKEDNCPLHDVRVTLRILPRLIKYTGSHQHGIKSRGWGSHDGESYKIINIEKVEKGSYKNVDVKITRKKRRKVTSTNFQLEDNFGFYMEYDKRSFIEWPSQLKDVVHESRKSNKPQLLLKIFAPLVGTDEIKFASLVELKVVTIGPSEAVVDGNAGSKEAKNDVQFLWPYWKVKVAQFDCYFESAREERFCLSYVKQGEYCIKKEGSTPDINGVEDVIFDDDGSISIEKTLVPQPREGGTVVPATKSTVLVAKDIAKYYWKKR